MALVDNLFLHLRRWGAMRALDTSTGKSLALDRSLDLTG